MRHRTWLLVAALAMLALAGCSDDKSATLAGTLYGCNTQSDCLTGYSCFCNLCQKPGSQAVCLDAGSEDAGATDASSADVADAQDSGVPDSSPADVISLDAQPDVPKADVQPDVLPVTCNLVDWSGCPAGQGCYYTSASKTRSCLPHGALGQDQACNPFLLECGVAAIGGVQRPLRCDTQDKKCYPTCNTKDLGKFPCKTGETCYFLADPSDNPLPDDAGICAKSL